MNIIPDPAEVDSNDRFSERTTSILLASGWRAGRAVDVRGIDEQIFARCGLRMSPVVRLFLTEFSGIRLIKPHEGEIGSFDPIDAATEEKSLWNSWYRGLRDLTKGDAYPLGTETDSGCLLMRNDGAVFSIYMMYDWLVFLGHTGDEALEALCAPEYHLGGVAFGNDGGLTMVNLPEFEEQRNRC